MYMSKKPHQTPPPPPPPQPLLEAPPLNYYSKEEEDDEDEVNHHDSDMIVEVSTTHLPPHLHHHHLHLGGHTSTSGGEENIINPCSSNLKAPKKRAETWVPEETRSLINLRRETDSLFSTSKSNKHLWDEISIKMKEKGFDRSPNMCTDKWRNLLKEFKKAKQNQDPNGCPKMSYYKDIDEILKGRSKSGDTNDSPSASKVDSFMQFSNKERRVDPISTCPINAVATGGVSPWNWRETPGNGEQNTSFEGRVITIKWEGYTKRIGIDGTSEAIKETIKAAFRLRTKRVFWLEDEDNIIRTLDRDMPLGNYTLHIDEGLMIKVCLYEESDNLAVHTEDKIFYTEEDFKDFLSRRGWTCLREYNGFRNIYCMDELCHGGIYRGTT